MKPGIVLLCCDGLYQRDLANRIGEHYSLLGIVVQNDPAARPGLVRRLMPYLDPLELGRYLLARLDRARHRQASEAAIASLFFSEGQPPTWPANCPLLEVGNVNDPQAVGFVRELAPDLVCVNGTRLIREPLLGMIPELRYGMINLHTGLSPYARGGNCNLFALLEGHPEWVGVTVHHIDPGIDSGDIIHTRPVEMRADDCYQIIDARTFRTGNDLMIESIGELIAGNAPRVPQWTEGRLYLRRTGFVFKPYHIYQVNRLIRAGLIADYLDNKAERDAGVRLVENGVSHGAG